jgi:hypothetical protein
MQKQAQKTNGAFVCLCGAGSLLYKECALVTPKASYPQKKNIKTKTNTKQPFRLLCISDVFIRRFRFHYSLL